MRLSENIRYSAFWFRDYLTGCIVRKHLNDIAFLMSNHGREDAGRRRELLLRNLINHATTHCDFYKPHEGAMQLIDFPVINKNTVKEQYGQFIADNIDKSNRISVTTSGSTGTPFTTFHDRNKKQRNYADTLYFAGMTGYKPGHRLIYLKIWVEKKMKSRMEYWLQNIVPVDVLRFNDSEIESLIKRMESTHSTCSILGYASALEAIGKYLDKRNYGPVDSNVKSVIAISETLNDYTRMAIEKYFKVPVVSRYSNLENGIIAQQIPSDRSLRYLINTASYHLEILKLDSDEQAPEGEVGRIIITDLFNYALPMIRYDTGDIGAVESDPGNGNSKYFTHVEGRKLDILFDTKGNLISSFLVYKNMWQYTEIDQYQLIQETEKQYTFKINTSLPFRNEAKLVDEFKSLLGRDADFRIEYVSEIPLLSSGKRKKIVSKLNKN
jgi:phenylacetate-CoA ligase